MDGWIVGGCVVKGMNTHTNRRVHIYVRDTDPACAHGIIRTNGAPRCQSTFVSDAENGGGIKKREKEKN